MNARVPLVVEACVCEAYRKHGTFMKTAKECGVCMSTVRRILLTYKIPFRIELTWAERRRNMKSSRRLGYYRNPLDDIDDDIL